MDISSQNIHVKFVIFSCTYIDLKPQEQILLGYKFWPWDKQVREGHQHILRNFDGPAVDRDRSGRVVSIVRNGSTVPKLATGFGRK